jgi:hypothetical protein
VSVPSNKRAVVYLSPVRPGRHSRSRVNLEAEKIIIGPCPRKTYPLASCFNSERVTTMMKAKQGRYTLEFKQEAARLVESDQSMAAAARSLGVVEQTLALSPPGVSY